MSVLLGMASIDERGRARGGAAGDQTGREVYIRSWYQCSKGGWDTYILLDSAAARERFAHALEILCNTQNVGYDQSQRTTLWTECERIGWNLSRVSEIRPCECDCASLMAVCAHFAGINVSKDIWTGNLEAAFQATGQVTVYKDRKYLTSDTYIQRGGILLNTLHHVAGVLTTGSGVTTTGLNNSATVTNNDAVVLKIHSRGDAVKQLQQMLIACGYNCGAYGADGVFGTDTYTALCSFQKSHGLAVDGEYGSRTKAALQTAYNARTQRKSVDTIAREVIAGKWGNGTERTEKLEQAGYDPDQIQRRVNELV